MDLPQAYHTDLDADLPFDPPKAGMVAIYALCDPRDGAIRYIGKTNRPRRRLANHCAGTLRLLTNHKQRWINQLAALALEPVLRVLAWVERTVWVAAEQAFIAEAARRGRRLTNSTIGGEGTEGMPANPRSVAHLIAFNKQPNPEKHAKAQRTRKRRGVSRKQHAACVENLRKAHAEREKWERERLEALRSEGTRARMRAAQFRWLADPEHAALSAARWTRAREAGCSPQSREKNAAALRAYFADPANRAARSAQTKAGLARRARRQLSEDEWQRRAALRKDSQATPRARENMSRAQHERRQRERAQPEIAARTGALTRERWADPAYRARVSAAIKDGCAKRRLQAEADEEMTR